VVHARTLAGAVVLAIGMLGLTAAAAGAVPANDDRDRAQAIGALPFAADIDTTSATRAADDPVLDSPECTGRPEGTVWFHYTASSGDPVVLDTADSDHDTVLAVFDAAGRLLDCNDTAGTRRQARLVLAAEAGVSYLILAGTADAAVPGQLRFTADVSELPPLEVAVAVERRARLIPSSGQVEVVGTLRCSRPAWVNLSGTVAQDDTVATVAPQWLECPGGQMPWTAESHERQGEPLHAGRASARMVLTASDAADDAAADGTFDLRVRGPRIAYARRAGRGVDDPFRYEIFTITENGRRSRRLTENRAEDNHPAFSPDGTQIAFTSTRSGRSRIHVMNADGSRVRRLTGSPHSDALPSWSPNGRWIVFTRYFNRQRQSDLFAIRARGGTAWRITRTPAREMAPDWAPDGKLIAFAKVVDRTGRSGIAKVRPNGRGTRWLTTNPRWRKGYTDAAPTWSPDSTHVAFGREVAGLSIDLFTVTRDGSRVRRLTDLGGEAQTPTWGADGRIAFMHDNNLAIVNGDGSGLRAVTTGRPDPPRPYWWPDWARVTQ
jgi:Tol biopolymer transport system component